MNPNKKHIFSIEYSKKDSNSKEKESSRQVRDVYSGTESKTKLIEPPHLCTHKMNDTGYPYIDRCHVYTDDLESLTVNATIRSATNVENKTHSADWCNYPLGELLLDFMTGLCLFCLYGLLSVLTQLIK